MTFFIYNSISKPTLKNLQTNYTPSKSSRSSSIEQDETTIEIPHLEGEMVSNRKTHTPDKQMQDSNPALTATETGSDVKPDTKVFHSSGVGGDFMSRVSKGGKRLFIEEFPQASSTAGLGSSSDGNDRANPSQESTPRDRSTGGYAVETVVSQRPRVRSTERRNSNNKAQSEDSARGRDHTVTASWSCICITAGGFVHSGTESYGTSSYVSPTYVSCRRRMAADVTTGGS